MSDNLTLMLTLRLQAAIEASKSAKQAIAEANRYWENVYKIQKPNAEHEVVPSDWKKALAGCTNMLDNFAQVTEAQIKELNKPFK